MLMMNTDKTSLEIRRLFRYHSRCVLQRPYSRYDHEQRIKIAQSFVENEPLQGALADFIFIFWHELSIENYDIFMHISHRLRAGVLAQFRRCIHQNEYIQPISELATRWSVLLTPSSDVPAHKQVVDRGDSLQLANMVCKRLLEARQVVNLALIDELENEFISHCIACMDRIAFLTVWMKLSSQDWVFTPKWHEGQDRLDRLSSIV